jgi:peptidyl-prolyl cis-trans isomerase B (cyclophilin B)
LFTVSYTPNLGGSEVEGEIILELFPAWVPVTAWNFINLTDDRFYDGIFFHRVIDDFVAQSGDPSCYAVGVYPATTLTCGEGGSGETIPLEHEVNMSHVDGAIGMARSLDPDSAESQFYICDGEQHQLDPENRDDEGYVTFGIVRNGMSHVRAIAAAPTTNAPLGGEVFQVPPGPDRPIDEVRIISIEMLGIVGSNNSSADEIPSPSGSGKSLAAPMLFYLAAIPAAVVAKKRE